MTLPNRSDLTNIYRTLNETLIQELDLLPHPFKEDPPTNQRTGIVTPSSRKRLDDDQVEYVGNIWIIVAYPNYSQYCEGIVFDVEEVMSKVPVLKRAVLGGMQPYLRGSFNVEESFNLAPSQRLDNAKQKSALLADLLIPYQLSLAIKRCYGV